MERNEQHKQRTALLGHGGRARHLAAFAVLAAALLGATAACTGSSSPTGIGGTSTAGTSLSPTDTGSGSSRQAGATAGAPETGTGTAAARTSATPAASGSGASSGSNVTSRAVSGAAASCTGSEIKVALGEGGAGMSHDGLPLVFTNTSSRTCTMQGYPGAAIVKGSTVVLNSTRTLNGYIGDDGQQLSSAPLVTLAPGAAASAMLEWAVDAGETCYPSGSGTLEATPPNTTTTTALGPMTAGTGGVCAGFEIHPVVAGTFSN